MTGLLEIAATDKLTNLCTPQLKNCRIEIYPYERLDDYNICRIHYMMDWHKNKVHYKSGHRHSGTLLKWRDKIEGMKHENYRILSGWFQKLRKLVLNIHCFAILVTMGKSNNIHWVLV